MSQQNFTSFISNLISTLDGSDSTKKQTKPPEDLENVIKNISFLLGGYKVKSFSETSLSDLEQILKNLTSAKGTENEKVENTENQSKAFSSSSTTDTSNISTNYTSSFNSSPDLTTLTNMFLDNINCILKHRSTGAKYVLLSLTNIESRDQLKFPTTAVYLSLKNRKTWSRPIVDLYENFVIVKD